MNQKETTKFLSDLLMREKSNGIGSCWAREVSLDYGTKDVRRVDFMKFEPENQMGISGIEKGIFTCYEVKSCKNDFNSGFGRNFIGEKNYFVMPMRLYKEVIHDIENDIGVLVPIPKYSDKVDEFENPTELGGELSDWKFEAIRYAYPQDRKRPMTELLFCMLRSGH